MRGSLAVPIILVIVPFFTPSFAHEGKPHLMGTISAVDARHIEVKTTAGTIVSARLDEHTRYFKGDAKATIDDLKVGVRVVVHLSGHEKEATASEVHLASDTARPSQNGGSH